MKDLKFRITPRYLLEVCVDLFSRVRAQFLINTALAQADAAVAKAQTDGAAGVGAAQPPPLRLPVLVLSIVPELIWSKYQWGWAGMV